MRAKIFVMALVAILALSPLIGSGEYAHYNYPDTQENPVKVRADGFIISIDTDKPAVEFYSVNGSTPIFSVQYRSICAYSDDISNPEYTADLTKSSWDSSVSNATEEDGAIKTLVQMSSYVDMVGASDIQRWGKISFEFRIIVKGDEAQLGVSLEMSGLKHIDGGNVRHLALIQDISSTDDVKEADGRLYVSGVNYRWDPTATESINESGVERNVEVSSIYSNDTLYLIYPYDTGVQDISHYSGRVDIGSYGVIRDVTGEILGYGLGILLGSVMLGIPYAAHRKREKSPFDMDSPLYKK